MTLDLHDLDAVLLDVDGTLVDTTYLHAVAWSESFADAGRPRPTADLHALIGMASDKLIAEALADAPPARQLAEELEEGHARRYRESWPRLRPLPGARELLKHLHDKGITTVLVSSAGPDELEALRSALDADDHIDVVASPDEAGEGKPAPDLVQVALRKTGTEPRRALMVGDAVWDAKAAVAAGVRFAGVTCGGTSREALLGAGADSVWTDPGELHAHLR